MTDKFTEFAAVAQMGWEALEALLRQSPPTDDQEELALSMLAGKR